MDTSLTLIFLEVGSRALCLRRAVFPARSAVSARVNARRNALGICGLFAARARAVTQLRGREFILWMARS
jgi:hypothetical protein